MFICVCIFCFAIFAITCISFYLAPLFTLSCMWFVYWLHRLKGLFRLQMCLPVHESLTASLFFYRPAFYRPPHLSYPTISSLFKQWKCKEFNIFSWKVHSNEWQDKMQHNLWSWLVLFWFLSLLRVKEILGAQAGAICRSGFAIQNLLGVGAFTIQVYQHA